MEGEGLMSNTAASHQGEIQMCVCVWGGIRPSPQTEGFTPQSEASAAGNTLNDVAGQNSANDNKLQKPKLLNGPLVAGCSMGHIPLSLHVSRWDAGPSSDSLCLVSTQTGGTAAALGGCRGRIRALKWNISSCQAGSVVQNEATVKQGFPV